MEARKHIEAFLEYQIAAIDAAMAALQPKWEVAPSTQRRTSLEELPPKTGRSCTSTTRRPSRAAVMAAHTPANPPPTTAKSQGRSTDRRAR